MGAVGRAGRACLGQQEGRGQRQGGFRLQQAGPGHLPGQARLLSKVLTDCLGVQGTGPRGPCPLCRAPRRRTPEAP